MTALLVALGAAVGAPLRHVVGHHLDGRMPWGILLVNVAGSFLLGVFSALALSGSAMALLGTGFCGGLTTYSSFAIQAHDRGRVDGGLIVVATVVPALMLCGLGFAVGAQA